MEIQNPFFQNKTCHYCQVKLTLSQALAGNVCHDIQCRIAWQQDIYKKEQARQQKQLEKERAFKVRARAYCDQLINDSGQEFLKPITVSIVPANETPLTDVSLQRIEKFRNHLQQCINETQAQETQNRDDAGERARETDSLINAETHFERQALIQACTTCKGFCCLRGGETHAYQDLPNMARYMQKNRDKDSETVIAEYLDYIPQQSYEDSCVYHTESGCNLPRHMRAEICNEHLCRGLKNIKREFHETCPDTLFIVAENTYKIIRSTLVRENLPPQRYGEKANKQHLNQDHNPA